ncbi:MAG: prepilin-type N-terminal cleavage/methylation domain-containing protein [Planctomycetaceae bacterium]|nr:prepilin-type N-terminal cleavage/methylation domain-containing protein [Planctomycetaceae bacterium]
MSKNRRQSGLTLTELLVVVAVMAILMGIAVPAVKQVMNAFDSGTGVRQLINAALSSARAIAIREQTYAGVRFQQDKEGRAYMIFIVKDEAATGLACGFRAMTGRKPMPLPEDTALIVHQNFTNDDLNTLTPAGQAGWNNASVFSVIFSPQGRLVIHDVRVRNKDGMTETDSTATLSNDSIFNTKPKVDAGIGLFYQDDYFPGGWSPDLGLGKESSVQDFILYSRSDLQNVPVMKRWSEFFAQKQSLAEYISPYTGELVMEYREQTK